MVSGTDFDNTSKSYDRTRPIHRINSPDYDEARGRISGRGHDCGCRDSADFSGFAFPRRLLKGMRTVPDWVPVDREGVPVEGWKTLPETEHEVEGITKESRFATNDVPFAQWHLWYDWNFFIEPVKGYEYHRGFGNLTDHMECEWDAGAFGDYDFRGKAPTAAEPGPMFGRDWAWPVGGEYMWIAGRWIYDCGHPNSAITTDDGRLLVGDIKKPEVKNGKLDLSKTKEVTIRTDDGDDHIVSVFEIVKIDVEKLVQSELHPIKALATARWEAVKFDENERHVPAIQFLFFACSDGGYVSPFKLNDRDYEFIVDLPEFVDDRAPFPIGHTPDFAINTIVLRPRLLVKFDYTPFTNAHRPVAQAGQADPQIEFLPAKGKVPTQVKLRVPMTSVGPDVHSYGVIVSLGWHDPERTLAKKVKLIKIFLDFLEVGAVFERDFENAHGERNEFDWHMKVGVNGRWFAKVQTITRHGQSIPLQKSIEFHLAEDDQIVIAAHGLIPTFLGEYFARPLEDRRVRRRIGAGGTRADVKEAPQIGNIDVLLDPNPEPTIPLVWQDIDQPDPNLAGAVFEAIVDESRGEFFKSLGGNVSDDNFGRRRIIPGKPRANDTHNPLTVKDLMSQRGPGAPLRGQLTAQGDTDPLAEYILHYDITYEDLPN